MLNLIIRGLLLSVMSGFSEDYIFSIVNNVASASNLTTWSYATRDFENKAQNYFGVLIPVVITSESSVSNDAEISIRLVLKMAPTDERFRVSGALAVMFARETCIYSVVLSQYHKLYRKYSLTEYIAPKCYYVCREPGREVLVMQDMTFEGYHPFLNSMFLNYDHIIVALESLAQFHAYSFIMKENDKTTYDEAINVCKPVTRETHGRFMQILQDRLAKALQKFEGTEYVHVLENLKENCVTYIEAFSKTDRTCIGHGDLWKENILFKYEVKLLISLIFLEFQKIFRNS